MKIAIIGATGYIGESLTYQFLTENKSELYLFVRSREKMVNFLKRIKPDNDSRIYTMNQFGDFKYDVIINCAGMGNSATLQKNRDEIFKLTKDIDDLIIDYLKLNPKVFYINLSSGAVYRNGINQRSEGEIMSVPLSNIPPEDYYSVAKMRSEITHRSLKNFNIVDIRVFSFFSRFISVDSGFFIAEVIKSIRENYTFHTTKENMIRDYVITEDLFSFIKLILKKESLNDFFDIYSKKPVSKIELLKILAEKYGLNYEFKDDLIKSSPTGSKMNYYSMDKKAETVLGYHPKFNSVEGILLEMQQGPLLN